MRTLVRKPLRDLRSMKVRATTIVLMVAAGMGVYAGMSMSRETLFHTRDTLYEELRLADLRVRTTPAAPDELPSLADIPGVARRARRFVTPGAVELKNGRPLASVIVYLEDGPQPGVNNLRIQQGAWGQPGTDHAVVIDRALAEVHGFGLGDTLTLNPYTMPTEVVVSGIGMSPEHLIATVDATVFFPLKGSLGVVYAPMGLVESFFGYPMYNEFSFLYAPDADPAAVEKRILDRLRPLGIESVVRRNEEFAYRFLEESMKGFSAFLPSLILVFGVIIFLVTLITAHRLVVAQRKEIGVLRALGYRRGEIVSSYLLLAGTLCLLGAALGVVFALLFNRLFAGQYAFALGLPEIIPKVVIRHLVAGACMTAAVVVLGFLIPLLPMTRRAPQRIIRDEGVEGFRGVPGLLGRMGRCLSRWWRPGVAVRFGVRNLFRRFGLTSVTVMSVALSVALAGSFVIVLRSLDGYKEASLKREGWDVIVNFRYPLAMAEVEGIASTSGVREAVVGVTGFGQVKRDGWIEDYRLLGFPASGWLRDLELVAGRMFRSDNEKGIILNRNWIDGDRPPPRLGETVEVTAGARTEALTVVGLMSDMTVGQAYVPLATAQALFGMEGQANDLMGTVGRPVAEVQERLYAHEAVKEVFTRVEIERAMEEYMGNLDGIIHASIGVGVGIALLFLFGSVVMNLLEREMEYATLRALGYDAGRISRMVLTELLLEGTTAVLLSAPLAVLLALFINHQSSQIYFPIATVVKGTDLMRVSLWALVAIPLASLPALRHLFRMNIATVVRQKVMD